jgi:cytochrome P450
MIGFARVYPMLVIFRLIGIPESASDQLARWSTDFLTMLFVPLPPQQQLECARSYLALQQYVYQLLEQRRANPQDDFASALLNAVEEEQADLQMFEVLELLLDLIVAGYVTTSDFLGLCLYNLLSRREYWKAIQENPALIPAVVEEMLRFDTPGLSLLRVTTEDVELGGVVIPKDAIVYVLESSANHDEEYFAHPEEFNPYRENRHHLAFGRGIHFCIGAPLARLEAQLTLELLSQRLSSLRLVPNQEVTYVPNLALRGLQSLLVEWDD